MEPLEHIKMAIDRYRAAFPLVELRAAHEEAIAARAAVAEFEPKEGEDPQRVADWQNMSEDLDGAIADLSRAIADAEERIAPLLRVQAYMEKYAGNAAAPPE